MCSFSDDLQVDRFLFMRDIYVTPSNAEFYEILQEDAAAGETNWTVNKNCRPGDVIALYICAPVSAIVATALIAAPPEKDEDAKSPWLGKYLADMENLQMLDEPLERIFLMKKFTGWKYFSQPRNAVKVPDDIAPALSILLKI